MPDRGITKMWGYRGEHGKEPKISDKVAETRRFPCIPFL